MCTPFAAEVYLDLLWIALVPSDCNVADRRKGRRLPLGKIDPMEITMSNTKSPLKAFSAIIVPRSKRGQGANLRRSKNSFAERSQEMKSRNLDTTGAIYGQLGGAFYGVNAIREGWIERLTMGDFIRERADALFDFSTA
jgi:hypothetical protein